MNYKTQNGLLNALTKAREKPMTVSRAWWFENAKYALIKNWGWTEETASKYIAAYHPSQSAYKANA